MRSHKPTVTRAKRSKECIPSKEEVKNMTIGQYIQYFDRYARLKSLEYTFTKTVQ